jgi:hypothetical protein
MTYLDCSNGARSCPTGHTHEDVGVPSAGMQACATPTTPKPSGCETKTGSDRKTYAQIVERRQKEARDRLTEMQTWAVDVTEQLHNEQSKFLQEFDENEKRMFGLIP